MTPYLLICPALLLVSAAAMGFTFRQLQVARRHLRVLNSHRIAAHSAIQKSRMDLLEVRNRAKLLEDTVSGGASAVEKVHKAISNTTFGLIDLFSEDAEFRESTRKARQTHDQTSETLYKTVRTTNKALHILADTLIIGKAEKRIVSRKPGRNRAPDKSG
ncbi:hypothetical protein QQF73_09370 [Marinobacter sp. M216]|uniref:Chemotaxis protein n=1 Tax=Marinobacter albus TaxID=3030833 RepID=A0ABT7HBT1_9GAMM|nr:MULTISPECIES: hypothetical protein [unclassified Marinobacter]MBW7469909.1 hypothetical protein [Marinobacter sp. F4218]MDK9557831.1 hypothetical protein [Marinobacter sp. M216]